MRLLRAVAPAALLAGLFFFTVFRFDDIAALIEPLAPGKRLFVERESLPVLACQHAALAFGTSLAAFLVAFPLGLFTAVAASGGLTGAIDKFAALGETFPTVALMALLVPALGYGTPPVALALGLYGILPVVRNTVAGIRSVSADSIDAARGLGMTDTQILLKVRLPLAAPLIIQGLRISLVVNIAAATVGAAVGAGGLGVPIVSGIRSFDTLLILKGSLPVALMALASDSALKALAAIAGSPVRRS
ncbi:MAG: ABC transporter permease [Spirochaetales bacterium]|nr:ABC transporter permease [Spirochaetales bacterium]MBP7263692.1 ABC transporter permease [Spirochaetia bacterium]